MSLYRKFTFAISSPDEFLVSESERKFTFAIIARPSVCLLSVTKFSAMFLRHLVPWPFGKNFTEIVPTPPLGELNTRVVAEDSDFGCIERYISETVQDRN